MLQVFNYKKNKKIKKEGNVLNGFVDILSFKTN